MELAKEWVTTQPIYKGAFVDALALRYRWTLTQTPTNCACGTNFTIEHAFSCPRGGFKFPSIRHNEILDLTVSLLTEVCNDVLVEPEQMRSWLVVLQREQG